MKKLRLVSGKALRASFALSAALGGIAAFVACGSNDSSVLVQPGYNSSGGPGSGDGGGVGEGGQQTILEAQAEQLFRALQPDLITSCGGSGGSCHVNGTYQPTPPKFLGPPDPYVSIKADPNIVVSNVFASAMLTKGQHEGPSLDSQPNDLETRVLAWLNAEALALAAVPLPTTDPFTVATGPNDIDISKAATGLTNVHLKFNAAMAGGILTLTNVTISGPAGQGIHVVHPLFHRVPANKPANQPDTSDPQDSFSNSDQTVPGGQDNTLDPGTVVFSGTGWVPWGTGDQLRVEFYKLTTGTVSEASTPAQCANATNFGSMVVPQFFQNKNDGSPLNCTSGNCHGANGAGQGAMDLSGIQNGGTNYAATCAAVLNKVNKGNPAQSLIILKPTDGATPHVGGKVTNTAQFATDFTNIIKGNQVF